MSQQHDKAWEQFIGYMKAAQAKAGDRFVPVGLICMQADAGDGSEYVEVHPDKDTMMIWPADLPIERRGEILIRAAEHYARGTVLRASQLDS